MTRRQDAESPSGTNGPSGGTNPMGTNTPLDQTAGGQSGNNGRQAPAESNRVSAFRLLASTTALPPSPSWGSVNSSGRRCHGQVSPSERSGNLSSRGTSSGEYRVRSASLDTPEP